jgi:hypothetical protein
MDDLINKEYGFIIIDSLLKDETELLLNCRDEAKCIANTEGMMKEAGFGRGQDYTKDKQVRSDKFIWLT